MRRSVAGVTGAGTGSGKDAGHGVEDAEPLGGDGKHDCADDAELVKVRLRGERVMVGSGGAAHPFGVAALNAGRVERGGAASGLKVLAGMAVSSGVVLSA